MSEARVVEDLSRVCVGDRLKFPEDRYWWLVREHEGQFTIATPRAHQLVAQRAAA
jgi:hypothetical protein